MKTRTFKINFQVSLLFLMVRGKKVILLPVGEEELTELYVKHFVFGYVY